MDIGVPAMCFDMVFTIVTSVGPQQFQYVAWVAQASARCCVVGSPAVATVLIFRYSKGLYFASIVGVQIRTSSFQGISIGLRKRTCQATLPLGLQMPSLSHGSQESHHYKDRKISPRQLSKLVRRKRRVCKYLPMSKPTFRTWPTRVPGLIPKLPGDRQTKFVTLSWETSTPFGFPVVPIRND